MKIYFVAVLLLSLLPTSSYAGNPGSLKVLELNFNSELASSDTKFVLRDLRFNAIVQWVKQNDPDILFLAEAWSYRSDPTVALTLARTLGYDLAYRLELGFPDFFYEADAILTKKSLHMTGEKDLKLPHSALEIGNGKTWVIPFGDVSYAVGVKLTLPDGEPLYAYVTHLTASSDSDRDDQARAIDANARSRAKKDGVSWENANVIIAGDFNSAPTDPGPTSITQAGYLDSFATVHPGDKSCSDCEDPTDPWFNPFSIASGQFPSQTAESSTLRDDYVFVHSPSMRPLADTLMFTQPYEGVWMSDHYGNLAVLGDGSTQVPEDPVHDSASPGAPTQIVFITTPQFDCGEIGASCTGEIAPVVVEGARGLTIENNSDFYFEVEVDGPGGIFVVNYASLNPGERTTFSFNMKGNFTYTIKNNVESPNPYRAVLNGSVAVDQTGY